jgi:hypothetical protein
LNEPFTGFTIGDPINSPNLQRDTVVTGVNTGLHTVTLSKPATLTQTATTLVVSHGYQGVELYPQVKNVTVAGTTAAAKCNMTSNQIVTDDGVYASTALPMLTDPSTQFMGSAPGRANTMAAVVAKNSSLVTMDYTTYHLCLSPPLGGTAVTLPQTPSVGAIYSVDNCSSSTNSILIQPASGNGNIDGAATYTISTAYASWSGYYTGSN